MKRLKTADWYSEDTLRWISSLDDFLSWVEQVLRAKNYSHFVVVSWIVK